MTELNGSMAVRLVKQSIPFFTFLSFFFTLSLPSCILMNCFLPLLFSELVQSLLRGGLPEVKNHARVSIRVCTWVWVQIYIFYEQMYVFFSSGLVCGCEGWILCCESIGNAAVVVNMACMDDRNPPLELFSFSQASKATLKQTGQQTPKGF